MQENINDRLIRPLRVNIITNFADRKGLWRHGCILERLLCDWGHTVNRVEYAQRAPAPTADLNLFIETIRPNLFEYAPRQWLMPMPEWFTEADAVHLPAFERILCATREAERLFAPLTDRAVYTGFESEDRYDPTVPRETKVLHLAGGSILKGTQAVLDAWEQYKLPYLLTVIGDEQVIKPRPIPNVTYLKWIEDARLKRLQNSHIVHLQPSETEGWGHTIHEGLGVNAIVVTTDSIAAGLPFWWAIPIPSRQYSTRCLAPLYAVDARGIAEVILRITPSPPLPTRPWLDEREAFRARLKLLLGAAA